MQIYSSGNATHLLTYTHIYTCISKNMKRSVEVKAKLEYLTKGLNLMVTDADGADIMKASLLSGGTRRWCTSGMWIIGCGKG